MGGTGVVVVVVVLALVVVDVDEVRCPMRWADAEGVPAPAEQPAKPRAPAITTTLPHHRDALVCTSTQ